MNKLKAKIDLHAFFDKDQWYKILNEPNSHYVMLCKDNNKVFFSVNMNHHISNPTSIIQVHMYIWDYFHKPVKMLRKEKLLKINHL